MEFQDVIKLLEKTILVICQVIVECQYERRIYFNLKILKNTKRAKSMLHDNEAKFQDDTALFGNDFYATMYPKLKEIVRHVTKKPKLTIDQPFRQVRDYLILLLHKLGWLIN